MNLVSILQSIFSSKAKNIGIESEHNRPIRIAANMLKSIGIDCRCGGIAIPANKAGNIYKCLRSDQQFVNKSYNLGHRQHSNLITTLPKISNQLIDMEYYAAAVIMLKKEHKY